MIKFYYILKFYDNSPLVTFLFVFGYKLYYKYTYIFSNPLNLCRIAMRKKGDNLYMEIINNYIFFKLNNEHNFVNFVHILCIVIF